MFLSGIKDVLFYAVAFTYLSGMGSAVASAQLGKKPFTLADEIALAHFGDPYVSSFSEEAVRVSPDGNYFAVDTVRGQLDLNRLEDTLRFYRSQDIEDFLNHSNESKSPSPVWIVNRPGKEAPIINSDWRWLSDSSGVAFIESTSVSKRRLFLADLRKKQIEPLTSETETVKDFDIRDRQHYVYTATDSVELKKVQDEREAPAIVGTGRSLVQLLLPDDPVVVRQSRIYTHPILWAVVGGERFQVKHDGKVIVSHESLALSPDYDSVVTILPVSEVPLSWESLYPPPFASSHFRIRAGRDSAQQYVRISLQTGSVQALTDAPISNDAGWWALAPASWSSDGQEILLPGTFLSSKNNAPSRPCLAIVDISSNTRTCVWRMKGHTGPSPNEVEEGYYVVYGARFAGKVKDRVTVRFQDYACGSYRSIEHRRTADGAWQVAGQNKEVAEVGANGLEVAVKQGLNEPPRLVATNKQASRVVLDPNPQLRNIALGQVEVYTWTTKEGRAWRGGLYKPINYKAGQRYPLVIQTHGFMKTLFMPSGLFPTANAARALAAAGILVLQVDEPCPLDTPYEGSCAVSGYEVAANQLVSEGLVDPDNIGIIGFSRTCFYVMETLTFGALRFKAASITDGVMETYVQYILSLSPDPEADSMIGAKPFGEGLQQWLKRSPGFNLDKVTTPLLVVAEGPFSLLSFMWEPYSGLRQLQKPVDLIMLNTDEHVLTNPSVRMASQGGTVDWFRFWLQDYEDPDPTKAEQYARWRELRKLQAENGNSLTQARTASN